MMGRVVAIHQPNFMPWLGYFHKMAYADLFVLLDNVQFPKGSFANRVKIWNRSRESTWLSVPVQRYKSHQTYNEIRLVTAGNWPARHANLLRDAYGAAPYFEQFFPDLVNLLSDSYPNLAALNITLIRHLKEVLGIQTPLLVASELGSDFGTGNARNLGICRHLGADRYLSGQGARAYNDEVAFEAHGIRLVYQAFSHPVYPQQHDGFVRNLSVIDLLFNCGPASLTTLMSQRE